MRYNTPKSFEEFEKIRNDMQSEIERFRIVRGERGLVKEVAESRFIEADNNFKEAVHDLHTLYTKEVYRLAQEIEQLRGGEGAGK